ncbi:MAG: histidine kinase dimerization/phospho-acceptor domain-containing protein, partial [Gemmatimonadota bacterium]
MNLLSRRPADWPRLHPTVRIDYSLRAWVFPLFGAVYWSHLHARHELTPWLRAYLALYALVFPHLAYFVASRSRNSKQAELRNLVFDSFVIGTWLPVLDFALWPSVVGVYGVQSGNLAVGGLAFAIRNLLVVVLGVVVGGLVVGFQFAPDASLLTTILAMACIFFYISLYALNSNLQSKRVVHAIKQIGEQKAQIEEKQEQLQERTDALQRSNVLAEEATRAAEEANRAKSRFLANMSHELRTPLNAIIGYSEMMIEESADLGVTELKPDLEKIRNAGHHLLGLINEVLDLSK